MLCDITVSHKCNSHQNSTAAVTNQKNARKANSINCSFWQIHLNSIRFENQFVNATQTIFVCIIIWLINLPFFIILSPLFFYFFFFFFFSLYWWWKQYIKKIKIKTKNRFFYIQTLGVTIFFDNYFKDIRMCIWEHITNINTHANIDNIEPHNVAIR